MKKVILVVFILLLCIACGDEISTSQTTPEDVGLDTSEDNSTFLDFIDPRFFFPADTGTDSDTHKGDTGDSSTDTATESNVDTGPDSNGNGESEDASSESMDSDGDGIADGDCEEEEEENGDDHYEIDCSEIEPGSFGCHTSAEIGMCNKCKNALGKEGSDLILCIWGEMAQLGQGC